MRIVGPARHFTMSSTAVGGEDRDGLNVWSVERRVNHVGHVLLLLLSIEIQTLSLLRPLELEEELENFSRLLCQSVSLQKFPVTSCSVNTHIANT